MVSSFFCQRVGGPSSVVSRVTDQQNFLTYYNGLGFFAWAMSMHKSLNLDWIFDASQPLLANIRVTTDSRPEVIPES